jgi:hypothetical protein
LRVLHVSAEGDDFAWRLSRQERALGLVSDLMRVWGDDERADISLGVRGRDLPRDIGVRVRAGLKAPLDYDVLHFHGQSLFTWGDFGGGSPFALMDVKVARALGRRILFTLSDSTAAQLDPAALALADVVLYRTRDLAGHVPGGAYLPSGEGNLAAVAAALAEIYKGADPGLLLRC